jgi:hypothetical protein
VYDIAQAVEDGATVRIYYESRLAKVNLSEEGKQLVEKLDDELAQDDVWCLEISGPSDELEVITTLIMPLSRSSECQSGFILNLNW